MTDPTLTTKATDAAFAAGEEAVSTATIAAVAMEVARATDTASLLAKVDEKLAEHHQENKKEMKSVILDVLNTVFGPEESTYVVKNRVPLLCQSVSTMKESILKIERMVEELPKEIDNKYASKLTEKIVYSLIGLIVLGFMGTIASLVFKT